MLSICRGQQLEEEKKIEVDKLKNVPSFAIFYWFLFWLSHSLACRLTLDDSRNGNFFPSRFEQLLQSMKLSLPVHWMFIDLRLSMHRTKTTLLHFYVALERWKTGPRMSERKAWSCIRVYFLWWRILVTIEFPLRLSSTRNEWIETDNMMKFIHELKAHILIKTYYFIEYKKAWK